jgi:glycosyltransferase involved in cell wall biosynthesis
MTLARVHEALSLRVGEVLVSEDGGDESILQDLSEIQDSRLFVFFQKQNLGLWENHLFLLKKARLPWIKFIQTDDVVTKEGFIALGKYANQDLAIVHLIPIYKQLETGVYKEHPFSRKWHDAVFLNSENALNLQRKYGNFFGRPSYNLYQTKFLPQSPEYWRSNVSADLLINFSVSSLGDVCLIPGNLVETGVHKYQDMATQSLTLIGDRIINSYKVLKASSLPSLKQLVNTYFSVEITYFSFLLLKRIFAKQFNLIELFSIFGFYLFKLTPNILINFNHFFVYFRYKSFKK